MKKLKQARIIALILMVSMITVMILNAGCGGQEPVNSDTPEENLTNESGGSSDNPDETEEAEESADSGGSVEPRPVYDLPENDFNGYNFRIISRSEAANSHWWNYDIIAEEENGDPINDAVYQRNKTVEEKYNITISNTHDNDVYGKANKSIKSGSDDYDLIVIGLNGGQENLTTQGMLIDLNVLPHVDLSKAWWDQKAVEQLSIHNKLFATSCDLTVRDKDAIIILTFSKKLVKDYELEDPYQLVSSGSWTFEKMFGMMKTVSVDINGDAKVNDEDQIGLLTQIKHARALFNAAGEYMSKTNSDGVPVITLYSERAVDICDKIREMQGDPAYSINADSYSGKYTDVWDGFQVPMFSENRALFYHAGMNRVTLLRTMETDFGILPPPKYDEQQDRYYAYVDSWCTSAVSVPITVPSPEITGLILEALTYESRYMLLPAYYDITLKTKFARDEESGAMIDIILSNRLYDLGDIYNWGATGIFDSIATGKDTLTTFWDKNETRIQTAMQKTIAKFDELE